MSVFGFLFKCVFKQSVTLGSGRGPVVRVVGSNPTLGMVNFRSLDNFIYPNLPQYTQLQMGSNIVGKVPAMD